MDESVLCVRKSHIMEFFIPRLCGNANHLVMVLNTVRPYFIPRSECETNRQYLQLIPYVVVQTPNGLLAYKRVKGTGESRLLGKASIGFGGHINLSDTSGSLTDTISSCVGQAAYRELQEELGLPEDAPAGFSFEGFVHSDRSEVDSVHLGMVLKYELGGTHVTPGEGIEILREVPRLDEFETWSRLLMDPEYKEGVWLKPTVQQN